MKEMQKIGQFVSVVIADDWQRGFQLSVKLMFASLGLKFGLKFRR